MLESGLARQRRIGMKEPAAFPGARRSAVQHEQSNRHLGKVDRALDRMPKYTRSLRLCQVRVRTVRPKLEGGAPPGAGPTDRTRRLRRE
jgi:hypothetical protein